MQGVDNMLKNRKIMAACIKFLNRGQDADRFEANGSLLEDLKLITAC